MNVLPTSPGIFITNVDVADNNNNNKNNDNNNNNNINSGVPDFSSPPSDVTANTTTTATDPPLVSSGASVIPPPPPPPTPAPATTTTTTASSITTTKGPAESSPGTFTATPPSTTTIATKKDTTPSSTVRTNTTPKTDIDPSGIECLDLFVASNEEFHGSDGHYEDNHQHTIIINNNNKAIVFDHKSTTREKEKGRGDDAEGPSVEVRERESTSNHTYGSINARERTPGSIITAICYHGSVPLSVTFLECQPNGKWNGTLPHCHGSLDVSSNTVYFSVIGGVCGGTILILALLYILMMKTRRKDKGPVSPPLDPEKALYVDPYAVGERLYSIPAPVHYTRGDITYAKPQIYGTYLNPSFYEDAYQRWRRQEQQVSEKLYDSPFINTRTPHQWGDNQDQTWTMTRGDKQMDKMCHIPRAKISPMDQGGSVRSHDSVSTLTFTGSRPQRVVYGGRSASVVSSTATMPKYGNGHVPRRSNSILEPPPGMHLVKAFDDALPPTLQEFEAENNIMMHDGRTPF